MKKTFMILAILIGFLTFNSGVQAQKTSDLVTACQASQRIDSFIDANGDTSHFSSSEWLQDGHCAGFVKGTVDGALGYSFVSEGVVYRIDTKGYTAKQIILAFMQFTGAHPELMNDDASETVLKAAGSAGIITRTAIGKLVPLESSTTPKQSAPKQAAPSGHDAA